MAQVPGVSRKRRALLSCTDKTGLPELAADLVRHDHELVASGGTARLLRDRGFAVTAVSELTGFPEIFGGRVKTLHPAVHGGILGPNDDDFAAVADLGIAPIDVVCVNLYRFEEAVRQGDNDEAIIEEIDIGGPALLRAAAKNFARVAVLCDPAQYDAFRRELAIGAGTVSAPLRRRLAAEAFSRVAAYDAAIAAWFAGTANAPASLPLRYGENPHQRARLALPAAPAAQPLAACGLNLLGGKELSYNNLVDLIAALKLSADLPAAACAIIKHTNPCGCGLGRTPAAALARALLSDPDAAFGGVYAFGAEVDHEAATELNARFLEIVAAPSYTEDALARLLRKKNVRVLTWDAQVFLAATRGSSRGFGGLVLHQDEDEGFPELAAWQLAAGTEPSGALRDALALAWRVCKHVKSNAIVIGNAEGVLGVGAGQMSRVDSVRLAIRKASERGLNLRGAVAASDGFFPFPDGVELLADAGLQAVIAPAGSIRDAEVAAAAQARGMTLLRTDRRHFRH